ncbi:MAG: hypothetical protein ACLUFN_05765 [Eubacterium sp.]
MRKVYDSPEVEIEKFTITDYISTSENSGIGDNGEEITPPDEF